MTPAPNQILQARKAAKLSQTAAAELIHSKLRTWQGWEWGEVDMHAGLWELFLIKTENNHCKCAKVAYYSLHRNKQTGEEK